MKEDVQDMAYPWNQESSWVNSNTEQVQQFKKLMDSSHVSDY